MAGRTGAGTFEIRIGARIESLRIERGLSVRELAQMVKCAITTLSLMESGLSLMDVSTLLKIARALRVRPLDLLNHAPEHDDLGHIIERMRQDSAARVKVKARIKAESLGGREDR